jgi:hypothetical protein
MRTIWDFFRFETFMAEEILIVFYFAGAVLLPFALWALRSMLYRRFFFWKEAEKQVRTNRYAGYAYAFFFIAFVLGEIVWRMMFEAMIAYFQMHEYIKAIAENMPK